MEQPKSLLDAAPLVGKTNITPENKENFFKAFMADKPYSEDVPMFGGKASVKFRTLTVEENHDVLRQIEMDEESGLAKNNDGYFIIIQMYRLGLSIEEIDGKPYLRNITKDKVQDKKGSSYVQERAADMQTWPTFKLSGFIDAYNTFEQKVLELTKAMQDPNFWTAAA